MGMKGHNGSTEAVPLRGGARLSQAVRGFIPHLS